MTDEPTPRTPRPRPEPLGHFVLARTRRLSRAGGRRFASGVTARHDPERLAAVPRLLPSVEPAVARAPSATSQDPPDAHVDHGDPPPSEAERLSKMSGYSPWAME